MDVAPPGGLHPGHGGPGVVILAGQLDIHLGSRNLEVNPLPLRRVIHGCTRPIHIGIVQGRRDLIHGCLRRFRVRQVCPVRNHLEQQLFLLVGQFGALDPGAGGIVTGVTGCAGEVFHLFTLVELLFLLVGEGVIEVESGLVHVAEGGLGLPIAVGVGGGLGAKVCGCECDGAVAECGVDTHVVAAELDGPVVGGAGAAEECNIVLGVAQIAGVGVVLQVLVAGHDAGDLGVCLVIQQRLEYFQRRRSLGFAQVAKFYPGAFHEGDGKVGPGGGFGFVVVVVTDLFFLLVAEGAKEFLGRLGGVRDGLARGALACRRGVGHLPDDRGPALRGRGVGGTGGAAGDGEAASQDEGGEREGLFPEFVTHGDNCASPSCKYPL